MYCGEDETQPIGVIDERVTRNSRGTPVSSGKAAVNDHDLSAAFDRGFSLHRLNRHMSVDDVGMFCIHPELFQYTFATSSFSISL